MNNYAPVFVPTLCRFEHFKRCVESLARCTHAENTELFIALDYPLNDSHWEGYRKIQAYIPTITGFASVNVIKREENYGTVKNYLETQKELFARHDALIFSEDDNEFSPNFLDYMNKGLEKFRDDKKVYAICGYNYPIEMPTEYPYNHYFWKGFSAWGYGMWKDRYLKYNSKMERNYISSFLSSIPRVLRLSRAGNHYLPIMLKNYETNKVSGDLVLSSMLIEDNAYSVFPTVTKVRNHGHDGSGAGCGAISGEDPYLKQCIDPSSKFDYDEIHIEEDSGICKILRSRFSYKSKLPIKLIIKYLLFLVSYYTKCLKSLHNSDKTIKEI